VVLRGVTARLSEKVGHRGRGLRVVRVQRRVEMRPRAATGPPLVATVRQGARGGHPERVRLRAGMATRRVVGFRAGMVLRVVTALLPHAVLPHVMAPPVVMALPVASARLREAVARRDLVAHRAEPMIGARPA
jgi:hypothetical protein